MNYYNTFSHIYIEDSVKEARITGDILSKFPEAAIINIKHYKDIFGRYSSNMDLQKQHQKLIIAKNDDRKIYKGSPVCHSFGNKFFYYTSSVKNCIYNCEYCYLRGMYQCGYIVIFVNLEDTFEELDNILKTHEAYVSISYDTDLLALENITGFLGRWISFTRKYEGDKKELKIEIRTKCGNSETIKKLAKDNGSTKNVVMAFSMSPGEIISKYEKGAPKLSRRIEAAKASVEAGFSTRLCFDPMIYVGDYRQVYTEMLDKISQEIDFDKILDFSIGSFRIAKNYMKNMRKSWKNSAVAMFPYELTEGFYHYPMGIDKEMENYMKEMLAERVPEEKIFTL